MFFNLDLDHVADGLNIDPILVMMALQSDTPEELDEVLTEIERNYDLARAAKDYVSLRNNK